MIADKRPVATLASPEYHDADCSLSKHFSSQSTPTTTLAYLDCTILAEIDIRDILLNRIGAGAASPVLIISSDSRYMYNDALTTPKGLGTFPQPALCHTDRWQR